VDKPQRAALYSIALRSLAGACSSASTAATMLAHRGGGEEAAVATTAATARGKACVCQKVLTVTSPAEEIHDHLCLAAVVVEEGSVVDADLVPGGRKPAAVAVEGRKRMVNRLEARDRRRQPRSWMLRWKTTSEAAVLVQKPTMAMHSSRTAADQLLRLPLRLETTIST
jgi:hypothetical protein